MRTRLLFLALLVALAGGRACGQTLPPPRVLPPEERPAQPVLPRPRLLMPPLVPPGGYLMPLPPGVYRMPLPPAGYYRPSAYQVWQYYGVTYNGWMRPRVINTAVGGYYLYGGVPFPWVRNYPGEQILPFPPRP